MPSAAPPLLPLVRAVLLLVVLLVLPVSSIDEPSWSADNIDLPSGDVRQEVNGLVLLHTHSTILTGSDYKGASSSAEGRAAYFRSWRANVERRVDAKLLEWTQQHGRHKKANAAVAGEYISRYAGNGSGNVSHPLWTATAHMGASGIRTAAPRALISIGSVRRNSTDGAQPLIPSEYPRFKDELNNLAVFTLYEGQSEAEESSADGRIEAAMPLWTHKSEIWSMTNPSGTGDANCTNPLLWSDAQSRVLSSSELRVPPLGPGRLDIQRLAWLHIPKSGTSFANVLLGTGCPGLDDGDIMDVSFANADGQMVGNFMSSHCHRCIAGFRLCPGHNPVGAACNEWSQHEGHFVSMFRSPEQRLLSGYYAKRHGLRDYTGPFDETHPLMSYAKLMQGCTTRMLIGLPCGISHPSTPPHVPTENQTQLAISRLSGFAFIGLTDQWELSVCLFHAMFGGECQSREFANVRPHSYYEHMSDASGAVRANHSSKYDTAPLGNWTDKADGQVWLAARKMFWNNVLKYSVSWKTCRENICKGPMEHYFKKPTS